MRGCGCGKCGGGNERGWKHRDTEAQRPVGIVSEVFAALSHEGVETVVARSFASLRMTATEDVF
jgi:hypothetical protein